MRISLQPMTLQGLPARIVSKIEVDARGCWLWLGSIEHHGYGRVKFEGRPQYIHRVVWSLLRGRMPRGCVDLDHRCCVRRCCNPRHLDPVSRSTNIMRSWQSSPYAKRRRTTR